MSPYILFGVSMISRQTSQTICCYHTVVEFCSIDLEAQALILGICPDKETTTISQVSPKVG